MNLQPLEDRIVVRSSEAESTTASGLVIPDTAQEKPNRVSYRCRPRPSLRPNR